MKILQGLSVVALLGVLAACAAPPQGTGTERETLNTEVLALYSAGKYDRAVDVATKALNVAETTYGPDHPDVAEPDQPRGALPRDGSDPCRRSAGEAGGTHSLHQQPMREGG